MMNILFYFLLGLLQDGKRLIPLLLQSGGGAVTSWKFVLNLSGDLFAATLIELMSHQERSSQTSGSKLYPSTAVSSTYSYRGNTSVQFYSCAQGHPYNLLSCPGQFSVFKSAGLQTQGVASLLVQSWFRVLCSRSTTATHPAWPALPWLHCAFSCHSRSPLPSREQGQGVLAIETMMEGAGVPQNP